MVEGREAGQREGDEEIGEGAGVWGRGEHVRRVGGQFGWGVRQARVEAGGCGSGKVFAGELGVGGDSLDQEVFEHVRVLKD